MKRRPIKNNPISRISGILFFFIAIGGVAIGFLQTKKQNKVADFGAYPCKLSEATEIAIDAPARHMTLSKLDGQWQLTAPYREPINDGAKTELITFLNARILVDEKRPLSGGAKEDFQNDVPTRVALSANGRPLCAFELGKGYKLPTANAERRWIFPENSDMALRTFIPLMDYAKLLEQPTAGWRVTRWFEPPSPIQNIQIWSKIESFTLSKAPKTAENPSGWLLNGLTQFDKTMNPQNFILDTQRIATILELLAPLYVDDWADDLSAQERDAIAFNGKITFSTADETHTLSIGSEVDFSKHPEWMRLGNGARYVKLDDSPKLAVMAPQRIMGLFPSFADMRTKDVWNLDATQFAAIEIEQNDACLQYAPSTTPNVWLASPCAAPSQTAEIPNADLALFAKTLTSLKAVRYTSPSENSTALDALNPPAARIRIYSGANRTPAAELRLSAPVQSMFRYAQTLSPETQSQQPATFIITEGIAAILLHPLGQ